MAVNSCARASMLTSTEILAYKNSSKSNTDCNMAVNVPWLHFLPKDVSSIQKRYIDKYAVTFSIIALQVCCRLQRTHIGFYQCYVSTKMPHVFLEVCADSVTWGFKQVVLLVKHQRMLKGMKALIPTSSFPYPFRPLLAPASIASQPLGASKLCVFLLCTRVVAMNYAGKNPPIMSHCHKEQWLFMAMSHNGGIFACIYHCKNARVSQLRYIPALQVSLEGISAGSTRFAASFPSSVSAFALILLRFIEEGEWSGPFCQSLIWHTLCMSHTLDNISYSSCFYTACLQY